MKLELATKPERRVPRALVLCVLAAAFATLGRAAEPDPWSTLASVRDGLASAGPTEARFAQTFLPTGFTSGERETGTMTFSLPDCLRWDYREPYPKSFLLCGGTAYAWNDEDKTGRRYSFDRKAEPGLDLLMLGVDDLKRRYRASVRTLADGRIEVRMEPSGRGLPIREATLTTDASAKRLLEVSYRDAEGNSTRFEISEYRGTPRRGQFAPPPGIAWEDER